MLGNHAEWGRDYTFFIRNHFLILIPNHFLFILDCADCVFPFTYKGKTCTGPKCCSFAGDTGKSWCSRKVDDDGNHIHGYYTYCEGMSCAHGKHIYTCFGIRLYGGKFHQKMNNDKYYKALNCPKCYEPFKELRKNN